MFKRYGFVKGYGTASSIRKGLGIVYQVRFSQETRLQFYCH